MLSTSHDPMLKKLIGRLHLWLGLASGLVVLILSITGCIYVFEKEIKSLVYADRLSVAARSGGKLPLSVLWEKAQGEMGNEYRVVHARVPTAKDQSYEFATFQDNEDAWTYFGSLVYYRSVFLDPYDGRLLKKQDTKYEFFQLVVWLHWSLFLSTKIGQPVVGMAVLVFVVQLLTGLVLWWPRSRAALRARLSIAWKSKLRRLIWDLHGVLGFYTFSVALIIALTGLVWAFQWFDKTVYFLATGGDTPRQEAPLHSDTTHAGVTAPIDTVLARLQEKFPGAPEFYINLPEEKNGTISTFTSLGKGTHFSRAESQFDRYSGRHLATKGFAGMDRGEKLNAMNYDIHVGAILGFPGKILAFLASLICATLPITGFLIWRGRRRRKKLPGPDSIQDSTGGIALENRTSTSEKRIHSP